MEVEALQRDLAAARWKLQIPPVVAPHAVERLGSHAAAVRAGAFDTGVAQSYHLIRHSSAIQGFREADAAGDTRSPGGGHGMEGPWARGAPVPVKHEREIETMKRVTEGIAVDLVVVAPMIKSLRTAMAAFGGRNIPLVAHPGLGQTCRAGDAPIPADLAKRFPEVDFTALDPALFHIGAAEKGVGWLGVEESARDFEIRLSAFREWLLSRPERSVSVVGHGEVLLRLAGLHLHHCQVLTLPRSGLVQIADA